MAATLRYILPNEVMLPPDLLGDDDTTVIYDDNGKPKYEKGIDDPKPELEDLAEDKRNHERFVNLALAYYNDMHGTDYKVLPSIRKVGGMWLEQKITRTTVWSHCGFTAVPSRTPVKSAAQFFCAKIFQAERGGDEVVTSCNIVDGIKPSGCEFCDEGIREYGMVEDDSSLESREMEVEDSPQDDHSHHLASGVILSDKAKLRISYTLLALAYYNKKRNTDYKLVDVLPYCTSFYECLVVHCNFIARQNAPNAPNKLFFAELVLREKGWCVIACRVLRGKTIAGCDHCARHSGKRVIHPIRGIRFGNSSDYNPDRRLRSHSHRAKLWNCNKF